MCSVWDEVTATGRSSGPQGTVGVWPCSVGAQSSALEDWGCGRPVRGTCRARPAPVLRVGGQQLPGWDGCEVSEGRHNWGTPPPPPGTLQPGRGRAASTVSGLKSPSASWSAAAPCPRGPVRQNSNWGFNARL